MNQHSDKGQQGSDKKTHGDAPQQPGQGGQGGQGGNKGGDKQMGNQKPNDGNRTPGGHNPGDHGDKHNNPGR